MVLLNFLRDVEITIINNVTKHFYASDFKEEIDQSYISLINNVVNSEYHVIFENDTIKKLLDINNINIEEINSELYENKLLTRIRGYLNAENLSEDECILRHFVVFLISLSTLNIFLQQNWVGPPLVKCHLLGDDVEKIKKVDESIKIFFHLNGEDINPCSSHLIYLFIANLILVKFQNEIAHYFETSKFWLLRCLWTQQNLYDERLSELKNRIFNVVDDLEKSKLFGVGETSSSSSSPPSSSSSSSPPPPSPPPPSSPPSSSSSTTPPFPSISSSPPSQRPSSSSPPPSSSTSFPSISSSPSQQPPPSQPPQTLSPSSIAKIQYQIELCHIMYFYYKSDRAKLFIKRALEISALDVELIGALGKRTRFQEKSLPQLTLKIKRFGDGDDDGDGVDSSNDNGGDEDEDGDNMSDKDGGCGGGGGGKMLSRDGKMSSSFPKNISLDDESVLDMISFEDTEISNIDVSLSPHEQCLILGLCYHHRSCREGQGGIIKEEVMAYINSVLREPRCFSVQCKALYTRCKWENEGMRYVQRSLSQLEELVHAYNRQTPPKLNVNRFHWLYTCMLPPHWVIQHSWASLLNSLGLTDSALEVYEKLKMYNEVIRCNAALGNKKKAEDIIRQQLAIKETPLLLCYLGDVTRDYECYQRSWTLSNNSFSRAKKSMGLWWLGKREFEKSLEHFETSLEINPLQIGLWFTYGCACLSCGQYDKAATGFRRCVNLEMDNFEAWNNLATAYIKAHNKPRAFITLQEAIKCDYENWRIWENYLIVSVDIGQFEETIKAYHRLLELRQKHVDVEVLSNLTRAVCTNLKDATGERASKLKHKLMELFGHITSKVTGNGDIWRLYAELTSYAEPGQTLSQLEQEKALQYLQKSHRCSVTNVRDWHKDLKKCIDVCSSTLLLGRAYKSCIDQTVDEDQRSKMISSAKLSINGVLVTYKKGKDDLDNTDDLNELITNLENLLEDILKLKQ